MSRILSKTLWGLALAAVAAFSALPAHAAPTATASPHIMLVRGGGGGGGGGGMGGGGRSFGGGGANFGGGGRSFASPSFSGGGARSFSDGARSFNEGSRSFNSANTFNGNHSSFTHDGMNHGDWNHGNWAWHNNGNWNHWNSWGGWGWGWPWLGWGLGVGWWPGYYYGGYDYGPYYNYYGDNSGYTYSNSNDTVTQPQPYTAAYENQADQNGASNFLDQGIQSFQSGDFHNAMRLAEHAVVDNPRDAEAHEVIALGAFAQKDYRTAATEMHAVVALGGVPSWNQVYAIYQNVDTYTSQIRALEDYVKANPKAAEGQFLLGVMYMSTGYTNDAHEHLAEAAKLTPKDQLAQQLVNGQNNEANRPSQPPPTQ